MKLKHPNEKPVGGFAFYYKRDSDGLQMKVTGNGIADLTRKVKAQFVNNGMVIPDDLAVIVEHQICLRQPEPTEACWNSGIGDAIHHDLLKPFLEKAAKSLKAFGMVKAANVAKKKSGCSSCGGTRVYESSAENLGRAGKLNKALPSKK